MSSLTRWIGCGALAVFSAQAQSLPQPPCDSTVWPPYPGVDRPPVVKVWENSDSGRDWRPPGCTGWNEPGFSTLVATVARFHYADGRDGLLRRLGAVSELKGIEYWSTTHQEWRTLIVDAFALSGPSADLRRKDFSPQELAPGGRFFFEQEDNLSGKGIYELHMEAASADRLVFDTANVSTLRFLMLPIFQPREVQSIYFLDREPKNVWRYYNLARTRNANSLTAGQAASSINRAAAFYRHLAGIPADRDGPDAR